MLAPLKDEIGVDNAAAAHVTIEHVRQPEAMADQELEDLVRGAGLRLLKWTSTTVVSIAAMKPDASLRASSSHLPSPA